MNYKELLLNCPFCDSDNLYWGHKCAISFAVTCLNCHANGPVFTYPGFLKEHQTMDDMKAKLKEDAGKSWNMRIK